MNICKIAASAAGNANFFSDRFGMIDQYNFSAALTGRCGA
jgi:hypothetical protein